jgi:hypothetical protein
LNEAEWMDFKFLQNSKSKFFWEIISLNNRPKINGQENFKNVSFWTTLCSMYVPVQLGGLKMVPVNRLTCNISEGQEKYLRELSITPVVNFTGAIKNHSRAVSHRNYFAWQK